MTDGTVQGACLGEVLGGVRADIAAQRRRMDALADEVDCRLSQIRATVADELCALAERVDHRADRVERAAAELRALVAGSGKRAG